VESSHQGDETPDELAQIYAARFGANTDSRVILWRTLVDNFFHRYVTPSDTVLDLAAGYCEFINNIECRTKIAIDLNPTVKDMAGDDVEVFLAPSTELPESLTSAVDVVWVSNFFEHLADKREFLATLGEIRRVLRPGGRLLVLQPNIRLTKAAYWDFVDHSLPITEKSLTEALELTGFTIDEMKVRFLPYTTSSRLPISPTLIRWYLKLPPAQLLLGQQTFVVARKGSR
jgi:SAM-dependent methyltransferase